MKEVKNKILVTAYVDNQLKSAEELRMFEKALREDPSLDFDLNAELLTKKILKNKYSRKNLPDGKREELISLILRENVRIAQKKSFKEKLYSPRYISFATAAVIMLAFVLLIFNRPTEINPNNISEQTGSNNMLVLARQNFKEYLNGDKSIQYVSTKPESIKNYFQSNGLKYDTYVPAIDDYTLVGASISEHNGVKLAHHYYAAKGGKFIYVFQAHEDYFKGDSIILLTNDLLDYLKLGNSYKTSHEYFTSIIKHHQNKVIAMVSNMPAEQMPREFFK